MKGVIFAAGLGTRLYPLTKDRPKALVEVAGKPMLERVLDQFKQIGIREVIVNVHAFADLVEHFLSDYVKKYPEMGIQISDERQQLLETGGGLKKMADQLNEPFLVYNVDVLSNFNPGLMQLKFGSLATLAVMKSYTDRCFLFNQEGLLCGWENVVTGEVRMSRPDEVHLQRFGFTGIHLIHSDIFPFITETGVFSITEVYLRLAKTKDIYLHDIGDADWFDIGSPAQLKVAEDHLLKFKPF